MAVTPQLIKELREMTSAGMMDCKKALEATNGNIDDAVVWLRENGLAKAAKKQTVLLQKVSLLQNQMVNEELFLKLIQKQTLFQKMKNLWP
nr:hypothetical protein [Spiroplasma clarkii]